MRLLALSLALLGALASRPAWAGNPGPCPGFTAGWALSGPGPITSILYDETTSQMYIIQNSTKPSMYYKVPISVLRAFSQAPTSTWTTVFNNYMSQYPAMLLQESNNCPVLQEFAPASTGFICVSTTPLCGGLNGRDFLETEPAYLPLIEEKNGDYLWTN